jgi:ABC-type polar amino acid transport system ATPase subunit
MIHVRALRKRFGDRVALDGVDARVRERECVAIVGPSGCGKSTLLRCLNALEPFDDGVIEIAGFSLAGGTPPRRRVARALRETVGMVFQELHLFPHLTALENVALAPRVVAGRSRAEAMERGRDLLARVGLGDREQSYPAQLSGGQKQRVAIARALAMPLKVLLLDEPTSALDPAMREEVREIVRSLARENALTLVLATHEMRLASELADRVWAMRDGRIVAEGPPAEVLGVGAEVSAHERERLI